ncbi:MAG: ectoine/hydroxyectoine ABC transporter substrate-binding protein EhuB [Acidobacteriota bacterium]|nr:ectoine/hydroxyectoine ABC transporter substrate-binding protein EhuB [Acidobacteriota bacterium]
MKTEKAASSRRRPRVLGAAVLVPLIGLAILLVGQLACQPAPTDESALERIQRTGVVKVGYANEAPYAYVDTASGRVTGEAPEVARAVFGNLGVEQVEGVLTDFGSLIPGLQAGRFDLIAAGMYITPPRCQQIAFSEPTYCIGEAFVVAAGNPLDLHSYNDVAAHESATLGVVAGTVERGYARDLNVPDERVVVFPDAPSAIAGVEAGRVDAYAGTSLTVGDLLAKRNSPQLERAEPFQQPVIDGETAKGCGAFGFRSTDQELVAAVNRELAAFLGSEEHRQLVEPFGFGASELPGDATTETLCQPDNAS